MGKNARKYAIRLFECNAIPWKVKSAIFEDLKGVITKKAFARCGKFIITYYAIINLQKAFIGDNAGSFP